jgi:hypothetical protein
MIPGGAAIGTDEPAPENVNRPQRDRRRRLLDRSTPTRMTSTWASTTSNATSLPRTADRVAGVVHGRALRYPHHNPHNKPHHLDEVVASSSKQFQTNVDDKFSSPKEPLPSEQHHGEVARAVATKDMCHNSNNNDSNNLPATFLEWFQWSVCNSSNHPNNAEELSDDASLEIVWGVAPSYSTTMTLQEEVDDESSPNDTFVNGTLEEDSKVATKHRTLTEETPGPSVSSSSMSDEAEEEVASKNKGNNNVPAWSRLWTRTVLSTHGLILYELLYRAWWRGSRAAPLC